METSHAKRHAIIVHSFEQAQAVLQAAASLGTPATLMSAPDAAHYMGAPVLAVLFQQAFDAVSAARATAVIDCGEDAGYALEALRHAAGQKRLAVLYQGPAAAALVSIAEQQGAELILEAPPSLHLTAGMEIEETLKKALQCSDFNEIS